MSDVMTGLAGAEIRRGDMVRIVDGKLFPVSLFEENQGAAAVDIPQGTIAYRLNKGNWKIMPPGFRSF